MNEHHHDVVVIGGGAAGRSAALVLGRARRRVAVVDAGQPSNHVSTGIGGLLGHDQRSPADFYATTRAELAKYPTITWHEGTVTTVTPVPGDAAGAPHDGPEAQHGPPTHDGADAHGPPSAHGGHDGPDDAPARPDWRVVLEDRTALRAPHVVLAMGMRYDVPELPDVGTRWGASVFHCPFCHGWEHHDEPLALLAGGPHPAEGAQLLRNWSADVTVVAPPGTLPDADRKVLADRGIPVVDGEVAALHGEGRELDRIELADGTNVVAHGLLVAAPHRQRSSLAADLGLTLDESGHVVVGDGGRTEVDGIWAVGDLTTPLSQVVHAAAAGSLAAVWIVRDLVFAGQSTIR